MAFSANASGWWADMNERPGFTQVLARWKMACKKYNLISRHVVHKIILTVGKNSSFGCFSAVK